MFGPIADNLLANLSPFSLRFRLNSVWQYYEKLLKYPESKFKFNVVPEETVSKLLQDLDEKRAARRSVKILNIFSILTLKHIFYRTKTFFKKLEYRFLASRTKIFFSLKIEYNLHTNK